MSGSDRDSTAQLMPSEKPTWRKYIDWLSPLLIVSIGLHGLIMLIPLPDKDKPLKDELPPPISVTELPKTAGPSSALPPATLGSGSAPATLESPQREPAQPPSGAIAGSQPTPKPAPSSAPKPTLLPTSKPNQPSTNRPSTNQSSANQSSTNQPATQPQATQPPIASQPHDNTGTTYNEKRIAGALFTRKYGKPEILNSILDLSYPAKGKCFDQGTELAATMGISVDKEGNIAASELLQRTVYPDVNAWLLAYVDPDNPSELPNDVFTDLQQTNSSAPPDGYITDWVNAARNSTTSFVPTDKPQAPYAFEVAITIEGNKCGP